MNTSNNEKNKHLLRKSAAETFEGFLNDVMEYEATEVKVASNDFLIDRDDMNIQKTAGLRLTDATPEGIEQHLMQYMLNELSFFPDHVDVSVEIYPEASETPTNMMSPIITNAIGNIHMLYKGANIIVPFMIRDRELLPFDTIQLGQEQAVFTRENLKKVLFSLSYQNQQPGAKVAGAQPANTNSYIGVDKAVNNSTDSGFLNDVLRIQQQHTGSAGLTSYAATQVIDNLLDKTAKFERIDINYHKLSAELKEDLRAKASMRVASIQEYIETEDELMLKHAADDFVNNMNLVNVHLFNSGSNVSFPEKDGRILQTTKAVVFKALLNGRGLSMDRVIIVTMDRRWADIRNGHRFLVRPDEDNWKVPYEPITSVKPGILYMAGIGNAWSIPFAVTKVILGSSMGRIKMAYAYYCTDIDGNKFIIAQGKGLNNNTIAFMSKDKAMGNVVQNEQPEKMVYYDIIFKKSMPIVFLPESTRVIQLSGMIRDHVTNTRDIMMAASENFLKEASGDKVTITLVSRDGMPTYNMDIQWTDRHHTPPVDKRASFANKGEGVIKGVLKTIGFSYSESLEGLIKAQKDGVGILLVNNTHTPWLVRPDDIATRQSGGIIDDMRRSFFTRDNATQLAASILGGVAGSALVGSVAGDHLGALSLFASEESEATASKLEKLAYTYKSPSFATLAKLMVVKNRFDNLIKSASTGSEFDHVKEAFEGLESLTPTLEDAAYELVQLKTAQVDSKNEIVSTSVIHATLRHLDTLHKLATLGKEAFNITEAVVRSKATNLEQVDNVLNQWKSAVQQRLNVPAKPVVTKQIPQVQNIDTEIKKYVDPSVNKSAGVTVDATGKLYDPPMRKKNKRNKGIEVKSEG